MGRSQDYTSADGSQSITSGKRVRLGTGYDSAKGVPGRLYEYVGAGSPTIDLSIEDYLVTSKWKDVSNLTLANENFNSAFWKDISRFSSPSAGDVVEVKAGHIAVGTV